MAISQKNEQMALMRKKQKIQLDKLQESKKKQDQLLTQLTNYRVDADMKKYSKLIGKGISQGRSPRKERENKEIEDLKNSII